MAKRTKRKKKGPGLETLSRSEVRYGCFRLQTETTGGPAADVPAGLREHFEGLEPFARFDGWRGFARKWDVSPDDPLVMVARTTTVWQDWNSKLAEVVPLLPIPEEVPIGAESDV